MKPTQKERDDARCLARIRKEASKWFRWQKRKRKPRKEHPKVLKQKATDALRLAAYARNPDSVAPEAWL